MTKTFFLTVGQKKFGNKILFLDRLTCEYVSNKYESISKSNEWLTQFRYDNFVPIDDFEKIKSNII